MTNVRRAVVVILCIGLSFVWTYSLSRHGRGEVAALDFEGIFYGARCVSHHLDPYNAGAVVQEFTADGGKYPRDPQKKKIDETVVTVGVNLPTALLLSIPFAILPLQAAETLWLLLTAGLLALSAFLIADISGEKFSLLWACLAGFLLLNCENILVVGNVAGLVVSFCVIAAWCFIKERFQLLGVLLLAFSLCLKPHDSGFIWLFFLLSGGVFRKRALQTLAVVGVLAGLAMIWLQPVSPHWMQELHQNHVLVSAPGGTSDPGPSGLSSDMICQVIDLQAAFTSFTSNLHASQYAGLLVGGLAIVLWMILVLRRKSTRKGMILALAAISALSLLPVYHRPYDAKLLLLTIPACAMLWNSQSPRRWIALALTSAGIIVTSDIPLVFLVGATRGLPAYPSTLAAKVLAMLLVHPVPIILLALGCFYLWEFAAYQSTPADSARRVEEMNEPAALASV